MTPKAASRQRRLLSGSAWLMATTAVLNLAMVGYHRVMSNNLGEDYATLAALTYVVNLSGVVTNGLVTYLAKGYARDAALKGAGGVKAHLQRQALPLALVTLALVGLLACLSPWAGSYLHIHAPLLFALAFGQVALGLGVAVLRAIMQGMHHFGWLGSSLMAEGVGRMGFSAALVFRGMGVAGALLGSLAGQLAGAAAGLGSLLGLGPATEPAPKPAHLKRRRHRALELAVDTSALTLFSLLCFLDLFVVKHEWGSAQVSDYSRMALVAKSFLYAGSALVMVLLPAASAAKARGEDTRPLLLKFLAAHLALLLAGLAFVWAFTPLVIRLLCGPQQAFQALAPQVRWFSAAVIPLALFQLVMMYHLALGQRWVLALLALATAGYLGALQVFHASAVHVIACVGGASTLCLVGGLALALALPKPRHGGGKGLDGEEGVSLAMQERVD